jgi:hypothetical protein
MEEASAFKILCTLTRFGDVEEEEAEVVVDDDNDDDDDANNRLPLLTTPARADPTPTLLKLRPPAKAALL